MLLILLMLWGSAIMGYLLLRWPQAWVRHVLTVAIWVMLFAIGVEVGGNELLVSSLGQLVAEALLVTSLTTVCCCVGSCCYGDACDLVMRDFLGRVAPVNSIGVPQG